MNKTKARREGANVMVIIGCDFHPSFQQVAIFDKLTGETQERRLRHREEAEQFYRALGGEQVWVGMEACGHYPWFERLLAELGMELWLGDAAKVRATVVRKQKTDRRDAEQLLRLLLEERFPRIWVPSLEERDAVAGASAPAGADADAHQEPAAGDGAEPGGAEEAQAVDADGAGGVGEVGDFALRGRAAPAVAGNAGSIGSSDRGTGPASGRRSQATSGGDAVADASGSGAGDGVGPGADAGTGGAVRIGKWEVILD
jgi:hypothetical protein